MNKKVVMGMLSVAILGGLLGWAVAPGQPTLRTGAGNVDSLDIRSVRLRLDGCTAGDIKVVPETLVIKRHQRVAWIVPGMDSEGYRWRIEPSAGGGTKSPAPDYFNSGNVMTIQGSINGIANNAYFTGKPANLPQLCPALGCDWDYDLVVEQWNAATNDWEACTTLDPKIRIRD